jgi:hypothetical protein
MFSLIAASLILAFSSGEITIVDIQYNFGGFGIYRFAKKPTTNATRNTLFCKVFKSSILLNARLKVSTMFITF